jgi:hypothetical protein
MSDRGWALFASRHYHKPLCGAYGRAEAGPPLQPCVCASAANIATAAVVASGVSSQPIPAVFVHVPVALVASNLGHILLLFCICVASARWAGTSSWRSSCYQSAVAVMKSGRFKKTWVPGSQRDCWQIDRTGRRSHGWQAELRYWEVGRLAQAPKYDSTP